jgi:hypothetical protein
MTQQEIQERNKEIALMLGADVQEVLERIYIDKMTDDEFTFHNTSVNLNTYEWNGTTNIHYISFDMLQFHSDWNWLMEAVEFIRLENWSYDMYCPNGIGEDSDGEFECNFWNKINPEIIGRSKSSLKEAVFIAVSNFAKLYKNK